jgi:hypothetical protein
MPVLDTVKEDLADLTPEARVELAAAVQKMMPPNVTVVPKFTHGDLCAVRDQAIRRFVGYPSRIRLDGMRRDLDDDEKRAMAFFEASAEILNRLGVLDRSKLESMMPHPYTADHEVNDEETVGHNFTQQKK